MKYTESGTIAYYSAAEWWHSSFTFCL